MVVNLKGSLKQVFNAIGMGFNEELRADDLTRSVVWTVDPVTKIKREQINELNQEERGTIYVSHRVNDGQVIQKVQDELQHENQILTYEEKLAITSPMARYETDQLSLRQELDRGNDGGAENVGLMSTNIRASGEKNLSPKEREKRQQRFNDLLRQLERQRVWLLQRIEALQIEIDELTLEIEEHSRRARLIDQFMEDLSEGKLELDENRYLINSQYAALVKEYELQSKKKFDPNDPEMLLIFERMKIQEIEVIKAKEQKREIKFEEQGKYIDLVEESEELKGKLANGENLVLNQISVLEGKLEHLRENTNTDPLDQFKASAEQTEMVIDMGFGLPNL